MSCRTSNTFIFTFFLIDQENSIEIIGFFLESFRRLLEMSTLYGFGDGPSEEVETIDSDEEDQQRSSRDPDK